MNLPREVIRAMAVVVRNTLRTELAIADEFAPVSGWLLRLKGTDARD